MPYQDAIAVILRCHDYHISMALVGENSEFHKLQAERLRNWLVDVKDYITKFPLETLTTFNKTLSDMILAAQKSLKK